MLGTNVSSLGERVGGLETAVMILIELLELVLGQPLERDALGGELVQDLMFIDRVGIVEVSDAFGGDHV
jgi:hypothetical protein